MDNERYKRRAAEIARGNPDAPFGCVIVVGETGEVVAEGLNDAQRNPVLHGETAAIINLAEADPNVEWARMTLYTTAEPCPMCAGALVAARVGRLVFGAADPKAGACGSVYNLCTDPRLNHEVPITAGVRAPECGALLAEFFAGRRR